MSESRKAVGIDIGGTKIAVGAVDEGGRIMARVTLSTEPERGYLGAHPELGHIPVEPDGPDCYCGRRGCFEAVASGTAIGEAGGAAGFADSRQVFAAARAGDRAARRIVERALRATGAAAWTILHTFLPQRILLGGGMMDAHYELFAAPVREAIAAATLVPSASLTVAKAGLGNDAGLVGAAWMATRD